MYFHSVKVRSGMTTALVNAKSGGAWSAQFFRTTATVDEERRRGHIFQYADGGNWACRRWRVAARAPGARINPAGAGG